MPFRIDKPIAAPAETPESLFLDLRGRKVQGLLAHQADVLREYVSQAADAPDVAFQLPTGSGKTLVGLLIGEWRRRKFGERVAYLCPTRQLVYQVVAQARDKYGLQVRSFTGSKNDYDPAAKAEYLAAETLAVTPYAALFNVNPFFADPEVIVVDDVHSAEDAIAGHWSVRIERERAEHAALYSAVASVLSPALEPSDRARLTGPVDAHDARWVNMISTPALHDLVPELVSTIDAGASQLDLWFTWSLLRDRFHACQLYFSAQEILIRPVLPPTHTHSPFTSAMQRVYMSATLGEGGELERLTGRTGIVRLPLPAGWDKQTVGRRLFFFPERSLDATGTESLILEFLREARRALVLTPTGKAAGQIRSLIQGRLGWATFDAQTLEQSTTPFVTTDRAAAVIANRYDGIDFPDEQCRLLVLIGLPRATNLQEQFLITRMSAVALLNDRIVTRLHQAFGRCTRAATDYSAIVVAGSELATFLLKRDHRAFLHPELQAELEFGSSESQERTAEEFLDNLRIFLEQGSAWRRADAAIVGARESLTQKSFPGSDELMAAAPHEIAYQQALWQGDVVEALACCRQVLALLTCPDLRGYRAWWSYLAGSAAWLGAQAGESRLEHVTSGYFRDAASAAPAVRWLVRLGRPTSATTPPDALSSRESRAMVLIERLEGVLERLGMVHDRRYAQEEAAIRQGVLTEDHATFEDAHKRLGTMLGFDAGNQETPGAPDPWWIVDDDLCLVFEDHSEADPNSRLTISKARQVASHPNWARARLPLTANANVLPILVTPVGSAEAEALPHLHGVCLWELDAFRTWAEHALAVIRELRRTFPGAGDLTWRADAARHYVAHDLDPEGLVTFLRGRLAEQLLAH